MPRLHFRDSPRPLHLPYSARLRNRHTRDIRPDEASPDQSLVHASPSNQARELVGRFPPGQYLLMTEAGGAVSLWRGSVDDTMNNGAINEDVRREDEQGPIGQAQLKKSATASRDFRFGSPPRAEDVNPNVVAINARNRRLWK